MFVEPQRTVSGENNARIEDYTIRENKKEKVREVRLDNHLKFDHHIKIICYGVGKNK